ncbi:PadR family transcriptional regulator [Enterococcus timonensis]|uniref:PadR family transcriptional regulator n=1 Tax=Enterococcus timonensis TaxID=1852364 RepID=UPI0008DB1AF8|nr:PadR family transcriptional regulator [Enterococcus timonensis]
MDLEKELLRNATDVILLNVLWQKDSYGYQIGKGVKALSQGKYILNEATMYSALRRLEKNGYLTSYWGDETQGARRKYFSVTEVGVDTLLAQQSQWGQTVEVLTNLIFGQLKDQVPEKGEF